MLLSYSCGFGALVLFFFVTRDSEKMRKIIYRTVSTVIDDRTPSVVYVALFWCYRVNLINLLQAVRQTIPVCSQ